MPVTQSLLIANVLVFLLQQTTNLDNLVLWPPGGFASRFEPWQMVTYSFLHGSVAHIVFNMFGLYTFGAAIERLFGSRFFAIYYFACVVSAALCHLVVTSWLGGAGPMVGASGGIYGLLLAYGLYFPHQRVMLLIPPIPMKARTLVVVFAAIELFFGVTGVTGTGVAHFAHLGGMLGGWLMIEYRKRGGGRT